MDTNLQVHGSWRDSEDTRNEPLPQSPSKAYTSSIRHSSESTAGVLNHGLNKTSLQATTVLDAFPKQEELEQPKFNLHGWRFSLTMFALCIAVFLSTLETTIISTSLISITDSLGGLQKSSWIVNAYLITYTAVLIISAKLSDTFGRKLLFVFATSMFTVFSIACGVAQTLIQLIVFRAFQGIGGGAMYSLVWVILAEMAPPETYMKWSAILSSVFALSALLGPLFGGLINDHSTWRWVFLLNGPGGALILSIVLVALPWSFPLPVSHKVDLRTVFKKANLRTVDWLGAFLLLAANVLLIVSLEEGGISFSWRSAIVLSLLCVSILMWIIFLLWSKWLSIHNFEQESIFPWRIASNRFPMGICLISFLNGAALITSIIILPQRFQIVNGLSPLGAGYRLLALTVCSPVAAAMGGNLMQKFKIPPFYILVIASCLQIIGVGIATTASTTVGAVPNVIYGAQVIMGFGLGMIASTVLMIVPLVFEDRDIAVGMGAVNQFRTMGGSVCISIATNVLNSQLKKQLSAKLSSTDLDNLLKSASAIRELPADSQLDLRNAFGHGFRLELWVIFSFCVACLFATSLLWERKLRRYDGSQHTGSKN